MSVSLTPEQYEIREHLVHEDGMILVSAGPGTGKSFVSRQIVEALDVRKVLYTAFNKAIVLEAVDKFGNSEVECKTFHALAHSYTKPDKGIRPTSYRDLPKELPYATKYLVLKGIESFFVSASSDMWEFFEDLYVSERSPKLLVDTSVALVESMLNKDTPYSFSFMLKYFHLMLVEDPSICSYDLVILDEINDVTAVQLEIFKLIQAPKKLGLGEPSQAIYAFMNLVDGFKELENTPIYPLTNSFRCSEEIAKRVEGFMVKHVDDSYTFRGTENPVRNGLSLYCTLTNAAIIEEISSRLDQGKSFKLLRKPSAIFACSLAVLSASSGKEVYQAEYKYLHDVYEDFSKDSKGHKNFFSYLREELKDQEVHSAISLIMNLRRKGMNLFQLYNDVKNHAQSDDYIVSTVYTSKGLEMETVTIADDLNGAVGRAMSRGCTSQEDTVLMRCYFVACSRAGVNLNNAEHM